MTDPSRSPSTPVRDDSLADLVADVLAQAGEIAGFDAARAEAWASDVLALTAECDLEPERLVATLVEVGGDDAAVALAALAGLQAGAPRVEWSGSAPAWVDAVGTSRCEGAMVLRSGGGESIAFLFVDALEDRHVITVDLVPGEPETVGEVIVGPGDLLDALAEDDAEIDREDGGPSPLAARCVAALSATPRPSLSAVSNGRLLLRRLAALTDVDLDPPVFVDEDVPDLPERDPEDDAYALEVLTRALGPGATQDSAVEGSAVESVAALVAPRDLTPLEPSRRDAVLILEWADWLGAVIGLVRAGAGCRVDGAVMVDFVNRCPEVTTTIPKSDRPRIEWAFETVMESWRELGLLDDRDGLTAVGVEVLPAALRRAWS